MFKSIFTNPLPAWDTSNLSLSHCIIQLSEESINELKDVLRHFPEENIQSYHLQSLSLPALQQQIKDSVERYLENGPGLFILDGLAKGGIPIADWKKVFRLMMHYLGNIIPTDGALVIKEVKDRGKKLGEAHYSDGKFGGGLHTDGAELPMPVPDYFGLMCVYQGIMGGSFQALSAHSVHNKLYQQDPLLLEQLYQPFEVDLRGHGKNGELTTKKSVFFDNHGKLGFTYLRKYIDAGHAHASVPDLTQTQIKSLDALDHYLNPENNPLIVEGIMNPGQTLFVNNTIIIHGRTEFENGSKIEQQRLLYRAWISKRN